MPQDPLLAANALSRLQIAETRFLESQEERRRAILDAVRADIPLRHVAATAHCSPETIRRIVAADGAVTLEFDGQAYTLSGQTVDLLIYKLAGNAQGAFAADVELLNAGTTWLEAAGALADDLIASAADESGQPLMLDSARAFALHQVLRLTAMTRPSVLASLADELLARWGVPPYHDVPTAG